MGYIKHHALIFSCWDLDRVKKLHAKALEIAPELTTEIREYVVNGGGSFAVLPDGSKEGWDESHAWDKKRRQLVNEAKKIEYFDYVLVSFDEEKIKRIED